MAPYLRFLVGVLDLYPGARGARDQTAASPCWRLIGAARNASRASGYAKSGPWRVRPQSARGPLRSVHRLRSTGRSIRWFGRARRV